MKLGGQAALGQLVTGLEDRGPLDDVLQLAHVARPVVVAQALEAGGLEALHVEAVALHLALQERVGQLRDVLAPLVERGQRDLDHLEAEVEVLAEAPLIHHGLQIDVGGPNHAHVHPVVSLLADATHAPVVEHLQELGLHLRRHVPDLVEEQRAAVGDLEEAGLVRHRAGEGALRVPEELGLEYVARQRAAVEVDELLVRPLAHVVQGPREGRLACPGGPGDEHRRVDPRHPPNLVDDRAHRRALALEQGVLAIVHAAPQGVVLVLQALEPRRLADAVDAGLDVVEGLGDVVEGADLGGPHRVLDARLAGHDDDLDLGPPALHQLEQLEAVHAVHQHVDHHDVRRPARQQCLGLDGVGAQLDAEVGLVEHVAPRLADDELVVDDDHADGLDPLGCVNHGGDHITGLGVALHPFFAGPRHARVTSRPKAGMLPESPFEPSADPTPG